MMTMARTRRTKLLAASCLVMLAAPAGAQTPPAGTAPGEASATSDLGKVSTGGGEGIDVAPSATGTRAQAKAAEHKAINKIIVQPQSEIEKLPDVDTAQALSRLPGISLETDSGEGRFINIRGLDADLNGTSFGGVRILPSNLSSPQGGGRAVAYDALPAGLVGGIEIIESMRPEDDAEALGGLVNLVPRTPPKDGHPFLNVSGGLGIETLRDTQILDYSVNAGVSFGLGSGNGPFDHPAMRDGFFANPRPFSLFITASQHNDFRGVDDFEPAYSDQQSAGAPDLLLSGANLRHYLYNRRRFSRGGEFDFDPNENDHFYFRYAEAGYNEHAQKDFLNFSGLDSGFDPATGKQMYSGNNFLAPNANVQRTNTDTEEEVRNRIISWGGSNLIADRVKVDYFGAYSEGTDYFRDSYGATFGYFNGSPGTQLGNNPNGGPVSLAYNNYTDYTHLQFQPTDGSNLLNQHNYYLLNENNGPSSSIDSEWSGAVNVTVPLGFLTPDDQIKTGAILRLRDRFVNVSLGQNFSPDQTNIANYPLANYVNGPSLVFYDGNYNIGPQINSIAVRNTLNGQPPPIDDPAQRQHATENVYAGYVEYQGSLGQLSWLTGVRLEQTFGVYRGFANVTDANGNTTFPPSTFKHAYVDYFPSLQLKYAVTPELDVRGIFSTALARPGFDEITPATTVNVANGTVNIGNPNLGATYGYNFDVAAEYFLPNGGKISLAGFDKEFTGYVLPQQTIGTFNYPGLQGNNHVVISTYNTSGHSRVYGVEGEFTQQFLFLAYPWDGFGIDSNFTYNQSEVGYRRTSQSPEETLQLPSTSPWNFNAALFYEKDPITFRIATNYVSKDLFTLGGTKANDVYSQQRFRVDLSLAVQVTEQVQLYFDAHNLTDTTLKFTETAATNRIIQREFYGQDFIGGFRASF